MLPLPLLSWSSASVSPAAADAGLRAPLFLLLGGRSGGVSPAAADAGLRAPLFLLLGGRAGAVTPSGAVSVIEAVVRLLEGTAAVTTELSDGRIWQSVAAPETALPYLLAFEVQESPAWLFGAGHKETTVQINIFAASYQEAKRIGRLAAAALDWCDLVLGGVHARACRRTAAWLDRAEDERSPTGGDVHMQMLEYSVLTADPLP